MDRANQRRANKLEYWMNLEAFEQTRVNVCGQGADDRTNKSRTDRSLMFGAGAVDKVVSFMYDPFYTCSPKGYNGSTLISDIERDLEGPLITGVDILTGPTATAVLSGVNLCAKLPNGQNGNRVVISWPYSSQGGDYRKYERLLMKDCGKVTAATRHGVATEVAAVVLPHHAVITKSDDQQYSYLGFVVTTDTADRPGSAARV